MYYTVEEYMKLTPEQRQSLWFLDMLEKIQLPADPELDKFISDNFWDLV